MLTLLNIPMLNLAYDERFVLFRDNIPLKPQIRTLRDMLPVLMDLIEIKLNKKLYFMYRNIHVGKHLPIFLKYNIRYDITIIPPGNIGKEFVKTYGHYHEIAYDNLTYPEIYEVIQGEAHYLLQKQENDKITDIVLVHASVGDIVIVPPNYGHVTINPSNKVLVMANLVSTQFSSLYQQYEEKRGGVYYELTTHKLVKNPKYGFTPKIRHVKTTWKNESLYHSFVTDPDKFKFLNKPEKISNNCWVKL